MKNFKFLYLLLAVVGAVAFTSCTEEWYPGEPDTNAGVYFPNTSAIVVTPETTSVDIVVERTNTAEDLTVNVRSQAAENAVDFLSVTSNSVTFAAGEQSSVLTVAVSNAADMQKGVKYQLNIKLDAEQASTYGVSEATFTFMLPEPWVDYVDESGKLIYGTYVDDFFPAFLEYDAGYAVPMQIQKHESDPNRYRVVEPFGTKFCKDMLGGVPAFMTITDGAYIEFDATNPADVKVVNNPVFTGVHVNFTDLGAMPISMIVSDAPGSVTFEDGVFRFAPKAVTMDAADAGSMAVNSTGLMAYVLPGGVVTDYKLSVNYTGMYVAADNSTAEAVLEFGAGADVEAIKYTVVEGDVTADYASVVTSIVDGSADPLIEITEAEQLTQEIELARGLWTVVAVPYGADGAVENKAVAYTFWFNGVGEVPQVEVGVQVGAPSSFAAEDNQAAVEADTPACFYIGLNITANASELKSMRAWWGTVASYESALSQGLTAEAILADYAADLSSFLPTLAENGTVTARMNVNNGYEYKVLFAAETIYGTTIYWDGNYTTAAYNGTFAVGEYTFSDATTQSQMAFALVPGKSYSDFYFVHNYIDGSMWYVKYDEAAGTITGEGVELNYEKYGSQWGMLYDAFNEDATQVYSYFSSTTADYAQMAPMVMTVENNAIAGLETYFAMFVIEYDPAANQAGDILGAYFNFTPETVVAPASGALQARAQSVNAKFNAKAAQMEACEVHSVIASEAQLANVTVKSGDRIWVPAM